MCSAGRWMKRHRLPCVVTPVSIGPVCFGVIMTCVVSDRHACGPFQESPMLHRPLGSTGLNVSPLWIGGNVFGWSLDEAASLAMCGHTCVNRTSLLWGHNDLCGVGSTRLRSISGESHVASPLRVHRFERIPALDWRECVRLVAG